MPLIALVLVLSSVVLHASWNAIVKSDDDRLVAGWATRAAGAILGAVLLGGATALLVFGPPGAPTAAGWVALVVAVPGVLLASLAGGRRFRRAAFPAVMILTVLDVVLLIAGGASVG